MEYAKEALKRKRELLQKTALTAMEQMEAVPDLLVQSRQGALRRLSADIALINNHLDRRLHAIGAYVEMNATRRLEAVSRLEHRLNAQQQQTQLLLQQLQTAFTARNRDPQRMNMLENKLRDANNALAQIEFELDRLRSPDTVQETTAMLAEYDAAVSKLSNEGVYWQPFCSTSPSHLHLNLDTSGPILNDNTVTISVGVQSDTEQHWTAFEHFLSVEVLHESSPEALEITRKMYTTDDAVRLTVAFFASHPGKYLVVAHLMGEAIVGSPMEVTVDRRDLEIDLLAIDRMDRNIGTITMIDFSEYSKRMARMVPDHVLYSRRRTERERANQSNQEPLVEVTMHAPSSPTSSEILLRSLATAMTPSLHTASPSSVSTMTGINIRASSPDSVSIASTQPPSVNRDYDDESTQQSSSTASAVSDPISNYMASRHTQAIPPRASHSASSIW